MEVTVDIHMEQLPEGVFLATSEQLPGLVAQGCTVAERIEIAPDIARRLIEARRESAKLRLPYRPPQALRTFTIVVAG